MANDYLYGVYGEIGETSARSTVTASTIPFYIGTAPVNLVRNYADVVNVPVKLTNYTNALSQIGYASDWGDFTLSEVVRAHFYNSKGNIGPVYVTNVLDPDRHVKSDTTTKTVAFSSGRAEFASTTVILDTLKVSVTTGSGEDATTTEKVEGTDYELDYSYTNGTVVLTSDTLDGTATVTYKEIDPSAVTADDIIGGVSANGAYTGLSTIDLVYQDDFRIINLIAAPGWSHIKSVYNALCAASQKINGHWDAYVIADLPLVDNGTLVDTPKKAIAWKTNNAFNNIRSKVCWPQVVGSDGYVYHTSTMCMVEQMRIDIEHNSVPFETAANKTVPVAKQWFGTNSEVKGFDQRTGNELTQKGITTVVAWGGSYRLWGDSSAAYVYGADTDAVAIFDTSIRMLMHITNSFQTEWAHEIDRPMTRHLCDLIQETEQSKLDYYVALGALLVDTDGHSPVVTFVDDGNSTAQWMQGNFAWSEIITPTPMLHSASVTASYSDAGFSQYSAGGDE